MGNVVTGGVFEVEGRGLVGGHIQAAVIAGLNMDGAVHDGELGRILVHVEAEDAAFGGGGGVGAKVDRVFAAAVVDLVVAEAGERDDLCFGFAFAVGLELVEAEGTVGRGAGHAAIFK